MPPVDIDRRVTPEVLTLGADSYIAVIQDKMGKVLCAKQIRSGLGLLLERNASRAAALERRGRKDAKRNRVRGVIPYRDKVRRLLSEYNVGLRLYAPGGPTVRMYDLREVRWPGSKLGFRIGYDLVMQFIRGRDLGDKKYARALPVERKVDYLFQTVAAIRYMHQRGFVHLDLKPSNIMVTTDDRVKLIDFGVSVGINEELGAMKGTQGYMAPEQLLHGRVDESTDIFGLGVTFNVVFGGAPLRQEVREISASERQRLATSNVSHAKPLISVASEARKIPALAELLETCTIPRRDARPENTTVLLNWIRQIADMEGFTLIEPFSA